MKNIFIYQSSSLNSEAIEIAERVKRQSLDQETFEMIFQKREK